MTEERLPLAELLAKGGDADFLWWPAPIEWSGQNFSGAWRQAVLIRPGSGGGAASAVLA